jgi:integral membrane protein (TIGR01906 family)
MAGVGRNHAPMRPVVGLGSILVSVATAVALMAAVIVPFLSPAWVAFEQDRSNAAAWTGYGPADLRTATNAILADLVIGPPDFAVEVAGTPVLTAPERAHMRDVRGVFAGFFLLAGAAAILVVAAWLAAARSTAWTRERYWRAVRRGALLLGAVVAVAGLVAVVAFDAAFELFHRLFFAAGTYDFDPRTYRLTQLFPDSFWSETSIVVGATLLVVALGVTVIATRRLGGATRPEMATLAGGSPVTETSR